MYLPRLAALAALTFPFLPLAAHAQMPTPPAALRYKWTPGQTLRYLIVRDPYFTDPARAIETADPRTPQRPPIVERLTERVLGVRPDGTATLRVSVGPEPGFEDEARPARTETQTVTVTASGQISSPLSPNASPDLFRALFRLPGDPAAEGASWPGVAFRGRQPVATEATLAGVQGGERGLAVLTQSLPPGAVQSTSPDHDGTLLQTTRTGGNDRAVFDLAAGTLVKQTSTLTVTVSLAMTNRGARGVADFGHVVPNVVAVQTLTIERRDDLPTPPVGGPSRALAGRQSKS